MLQNKAVEIVAGGRTAAEQRFTFLSPITNLKTERLVVILIIKIIVQKIMNKSYQIA